MTLATKIRFNPGTITATPAALAKMNSSYVAAAVLEHLSGNWGLVDDDDKAANDRALANGDRILSAFPLPDEAGNFWIITEGTGRYRVTTVLLPSDY